jgi:hypothetical protein
MIAILTRVSRHDLAGLLAPWFALYVVYLLLTIARRLPHS